LWTWPSPLNFKGPSNPKPSTPLASMKKKGAHPEPAEVFPEQSWQCPTCGKSGRFIPSGPLTEQLARDILFLHTNASPLCSGEPEWVLMPTPDKDT
jgi:hypothetical protein